MGVFYVTIYCGSVLCAYSLRCIEDDSEAMMYKVRLGISLAISANEECTHNVAAPRYTAQNEDLLQAPESVPNAHILSCSTMMRAAVIYL